MRVKKDYSGLPALEYEAKRAKGSTQETINIEGKYGECGVREIGRNSGEMSQEERPVK